LCIYLFKLGNIDAAIPLPLFTIKYLFMKKNLIIVVAVATTAVISLAFIVGNNYGKKIAARSSYTISKETAHKYVTAWQKHEESLGKKEENTLKLLT
jgi:predicted hydrocarbon binding protein